MESAGLSLTRRFVADNGAPTTILLDDDPDTLLGTSKFVELTVGGEIAIRRDDSVDEAVMVPGSEDATDNMTEAIRITVKNENKLAETSVTSESTKLNTVSTVDDTTKKTEKKLNRQASKSTVKVDDLNDDPSDLRADLMKLMIGDDLWIKVQFMDERSALNLTRPVNFKSLEQYFQNKYRRPLNIYYTTASRELMIQIRSQDELDHVVQLYDRTGGRRRMRLILSQRRDVACPTTAGPACSAPPPPLGIYHGISELALSETSSVLSTASFGAGRLASNAAAASPTAPPCSWREGRCLGRGAFGQVFVCLNADTGEQLVVKKIFIRGNSRFRSRILASLENEVNLLGRLRHPHIVQYFGVQERQDCVNIFMELMTGGSLKDQITDYGALTEANTVHFTVQILLGLAYLHTRDIVHRDIKPANILRHSRAHVKIGDFGSAKYLQAICSDQGVDIIGTPHYNAPEIIRDSRKSDHRSDIWSTAITIIEMLTERPPWAHVEPGAVHLKIAFDPPDYRLPAGTSPALADAIASMLAALAERRPTAGQLLDEPPFRDRRAAVDEMTAD